MKPAPPNNPTSTIRINFTILFARDSSYEGVANPPIEEIEQNNKTSLANHPTSTAICPKIKVAISPIALVN